MSTYHELEEFYLTDRQRKKGKVELLVDRVPTNSSVSVNFPNNDASVLAPLVNLNSTSTAAFNCEGVAAGAAVQYTMPATSTTIATTADLVFASGVDTGLTISTAGSSIWDFTGYTYSAQYFKIGTRVILSGVIGFAGTTGAGSDTSFNITVPTAYPASSDSDTHALVTSQSLNATPATTDAFAFCTAAARSGTTSITVLCRTTIATSGATTDNHTLNFFISYTTSG